MYWKRLQKRREPKRLSDTEKCGEKFLRASSDLHVLYDPWNFVENSTSLQSRGMTRFRPCIDLHSGQVKQIVGGTLSTEVSDLKTNYVSKLPSSHYARLYRESALSGAHVIMLGPGNDAAAQEALSAWPGALQLGGGINETNAKHWIEEGAEKVRLYSSNNGLFIWLRSLGRSL